MSKDKIESTSFSRVFHGILMEIFKANDFNYANDLHSFAKQKPFALKPPAFLISGKPIIYPNKKYWFDICFLNEDIIKHFHSAIFKNFINKKVFSIYNHPIELLGSEVIKETTFENLINNSNSEGCFLEIKTPLCFKQGDITNPLPDPLKIYASLYDKWTNTSSCPEFISNIYPSRESFIKSIGNVIGISDFNIQANHINSTEYKIIGSTGSISLSWKKAAPDIKKILTTLSSFGNYTGCGYKSTMGLGNIEFKLRGD